MKKIIFILSLALLIISLNSVKAEKYTSSSHKMIIAGTSTLHDWQAPANKMNAKSDLTIAGGVLQSVNSMYVECESKSIKSPKGESMDEKIYDALKTDDFSKITFNLTKVKSITKSGNDYIVETTGNLTIAGNTQSIDLTVKATVAADGSVTFSGTKQFKMSTFKVDPPTAMLGVIKCGDSITLTFDLNMKKG